MNIENLKGKLLEERATLEKDLNDLGIFDPETGDWGAVGEPGGEEADKNDMGDRDEDFATRANTLAELELRLKDVNDALAKIERNDGSFGKCEVSGEMIEEDRLEANPAARTCKEHM
ncbi:MAG: TraR/DksA C4-type zinc finger protein [Bacteroidetes bacterium]|nr:TraR/DksA C4-type zinc finger protein [Bacteroidota bacterium]